jgi:predicted RNA-binding protein YlxR (DUF448 family)
MLAQPQEDGLDGGPRAAATGTERLCAATGTVKPIADMLRFVVAPDATVVPDLKQRLPGRGIWVTATRQALRVAIARKAFARSFKRDVRVPHEFVQETERLIERAALDALSVAHKAGKVAMGFAKTEAAIAHDRLAGVLHASDAAPDGVRKIAAALRHRAEDEGRDFPTFGGFSSAQLDLALGRSNVIHAALLAGPQIETFLARAARLDRFRTDGPDTGFTRDREVLDKRKPVNKREPLTGAPKTGRRPRRRNP